jgi:hypothetical protein
MTNDVARAKVRAFDPDGDSETLWAFAKGDDRFQLDNIPFLAFGLSWGDLVLAPAVDGVPTFAEVLKPSGHSTYRLAFRDDLWIDECPASVAPLRDLGCTFERFTPRMMGVDIPPEVDIYAAYELLERGMAQGHWDFDEANVEHPLT